MNNAETVIQSNWRGENNSVRPLPCILLRIDNGSSLTETDTGAIDPLLMACIPHRKNRLPVRPQSDMGLRWRCADGQLEELSIGRDHADWIAVWKEINGPGLLVCEMPDGSELSIPQIGPVGHWILTRSGSSGWLPE
jgi:hypothetical protein